MDSQSDGLNFTNMLNEGLDSRDLSHLYFNPPCSLQETAPQGQTTTKKSQRSRNFSIDEDMLLVSAWLNVSLDAVHGKDQRNATYWERIADYFHNEKTFASDRNASSLMNRWSSIQLAVNKFCGFYDQIEHLHKSGVNEQDKIQQAKDMFQSIQKDHPLFVYEHCWNLLRFNQKWISQRAKKKATKRKDRSPAMPASPATPDSVNLEEDSPATPDPSCMDRPIGKKAAKQLLKKGKHK